MSSLEKLKDLTTEGFILSDNYECAGAEHWLLLKMSLLLISLVISRSCLVPGGIWFTSSAIGLRFGIHLEILLFSKYYSDQ